MLFSVEQAIAGRDEKRAPLKTPAWEASPKSDQQEISPCNYNINALENRVVARIKDTITQDESN